MEDYIMTSIETDVQFVDNASDTYMSDEEREYWIDLEEGETEEEEIEPCDDTTIDNAFNSLFGKTIKETKSIRRATKKAQVVVLPTYRGVVSRHEENMNRLANHFNRGIK
jgi:hypothetical protein